MHTLRIETKDETRTQSLAAALASSCHAGDCLLLRGDLGTGKTTFARGFIGAPDVVSPTFTLVQTYPTERGTVWHFDLYRLKRAEELTEIGLEDALQNGISLIEWPDLAADSLPSHALSVDIAYGAAPDTRVFTLSGDEHSWAERLAALEKQHYSGAR